MGVQAAAARFFYDFCLDDHVPKDHQLRGIDRHLDLDGIRAALKPFYSSTGRPSVDPELMIRMLLAGYCLGIRSERRLCEEVHLNLAYRWFCRLGLDGKKGAAREHRELFVSKLATVALGVLAILLGIVAEKLNVAFAVGLAFAVAASCNFQGPGHVDLLARHDDARHRDRRLPRSRHRLRRRCALAGHLGRRSGYPKGSAPFPYANPALFSISIAFLGIWLGSKFDFSERGRIDREGFDAQFVRAQTGIGAEGATHH